MKMYDLGSDGCFYSTLAKWKNLAKLNLSLNKSNYASNDFPFALKFPTHAT